ncbi:MAG: hypothetical protein MO853_03040 [Candidatus Protistobacter heckmanni]|nr:hypothetical protein [Candidatus Protistobacter heckmanni]
MLAAGTIGTAGIATALVHLVSPSIERMLRNKMALRFAAKYSDLEAPWAKAPRRGFQRRVLRTRLRGMWLGPAQTHIALVEHAIKTELAQSLLALPCSRKSATGWSRRAARRMRGIWR